MATTPMTSRMRHALSPAERWMQLRRAKPPIHSTYAPPHRVSFRSRTLLLTMLPLLIAFYIIYHITHFQELVPEPRLLYSRTLPTFGRVSMNGTAPSMVILSADNQIHARSEFITIYRPFLLVKRSQASEITQNNHVLVPATLRGNQDKLLGKRTTLCTSFDGTVTLNTPQCLEHARSLKVADPSVTYGRILQLSEEESGFQRASSFSCSNASIAILPISSQDEDMFHLLPKLLLAYTVIQRTRHTAHWLRVPPVHGVVLLAHPFRVFQLLRPGAGTLQSSLAISLLARNRINVAVVRTLDELPTACFASGLILGTLSDRIALPDTALGSEGGYDGNAPQHQPLSSDALSLRNVALGKQIASRPIQNKLLYVIAGPDGSAALTAEADTALRNGLRAISRREGIELVVFDIASERLSFKDHAKRFADSSVIVGVHGPDLAMAVFAPKGAALIEVIPNTRRSTELYSSVSAAGLDYVKIVLGENGNSGPPYSVTELERETLLHFVSDKVHAGKERSADEVRDVTIH